MHGHITILKKVSTLSSLPVPGSPAARMARLGRAERRDATMFTLSAPLLNTTELLEAMVAWGATRDVAELIVAAISPSTGNRAEYRSTQDCFDGRLFYLNVQGYF
jgi:hypothetical protein